MNQSQRRLFLIQALLNERPSCRRQEIPRDGERQKILLRGLMNVRFPRPIDPEFRNVQDAYLQEETAAKGGKVIIPAFSVGRSQEILYLISDIYRRTKNPMPVYLDSPLSVKATSVFTRNIDGYYDEEAMALIRQGKNPLIIPTLHAITSVDESKALNGLDEPCVIISSSGMCEAGRIQHHLKHNLYDSRNTIVFTGYQAEGTLGRKILSGAKQVSILGERIAVRARIEKLSGISGHADKDGLLKWIGEFSPAPKKVFVMHGEQKVSEGFAQLLSTQMGLDATAPHFKETFEL